MLRASRNSTRCQSRARRWSRIEQISRLGQQQARHGRMLNDRANALQVAVDDLDGEAGIGDASVHLVAEAAGDNGKLAFHLVRVDTGLEVALSFGPQAHVLSLVGFDHLVEKAEPTEPVTSALSRFLVALAAVRDERVHGNGCGQAAPRKPT